MPREITVYYGWIGGKASDKEALEKLGVKVGRYNKESETFDGCTVPIPVLEKLEKYWGHWVWGLTRRKEIVYEQSDYDDIPF